MSIVAPGRGLISSRRASSPFTRKSAEPRPFSLNSLASLFTADVIARARGAGSEAGRTEPPYRHGLRVAGPGPVSLNPGPRAGCPFATKSAETGRPSTRSWDYTLLLRV